MPADEPDDDPEVIAWSNTLDELDAQATESENSGDPRLIAETHWALAEHIVGVVDFEVFCEIALTAREAFGEVDAESAAQCTTAIGLAANAAGDFETARSAFETAADEWAELGNLGHCADALDAAGQMSIELGDYDEAERIFGETTALYRRLGNTDAVTETRLNLANVHRLTGRRAEAERELLALSTTFPTDSEYGAACYTALGAIYSETQRPYLAIPAFEQAMAILESLGSGAHLNECRMNLAWVFQSVGDPRGDQLMQIARQEFAAAGRTDQVALCDYNQAITLALRGDFAAADQTFDAAAQGLSAAGLHHQLAHLQWNRVKRLLLEGTSNPLRQDALVAEAVDTAISALIAADYQRFQFRDARRRADWTAKLEHRITWTFAMVKQFGSKSLLADLIESVISAGVYGAADHSDPGFADFDPTPVDAPADDSGPAMTLGAATTLLAGATLPLAPPPALVDGAGRLLLARQRAMAAALDPDLAEILDNAPRVPIW
ncbi:MAG: tetratricopeptide repeat protein [Gordonia sp. (in: high G+C Gram-positive bacteria)]